MSALTTATPPQPLVIPEEMVLSPDQDKAAKRIVNFMLDPDQVNLVLRGFAGTGKSTLLKHVLDSLPNINSLARITGGDTTRRSIRLTATTNKAAGALRQTTGQGAGTLHSELALVVARNPETHERELVTTRRTKAIRNALLIIDEAFMSDTKLLEYIEEYTENTKILWVGDPAQLLPVGMNYAPLIAKGFNQVSLSTVVRQAADSPIIQLATLCRYAVETNKFFKFKADGNIIKHVNRDVFGKMMLESFDEHYGKPGAVKVLSWTNKTAIAWNAFVKQTMKGSMDISVGDYVVVNNALPNVGLSTDQTVQITGKNAHNVWGIEGFQYQIDGRSKVFMPINPDDKKLLIRQIRTLQADDWRKDIADVEDTWADLRDEYACTINKSQGSTYGTTYIDLDDIARCKNSNALARLLYVAISRPRDKIVFTGDIR